MSDTFEFDSLRVARNYRAALLAEFGDYLKGQVLEVGAGVGHLSRELAALPQIEKLVSIEPSPEFCQFFRREFPNISLVEGTIANLEPALNWNCIISVNVLEHIKEDRLELETYRARLKAQRGCLCLFVPARPEIYAPLDADFGHFRRYTRPELRSKLQEGGFDILRLDYYNSVGYLAWWLNFCLLKKRRFETGAVRFFDRCIFPAVHWTEKTLCRPPIGQSLLAVAQARA